MYATVAALRAEGVTVAQADDARRLVEIVRQRAGDCDGQLARFLLAVQQAAEHGVKRHLADGVHADVPLVPRALEDVREPTGNVVLLEYEHAVAQLRQ